MYVMGYSLQRSVKEKKAAKKKKKKKKKKTGNTTPEQCVMVDHCQ